jgi:holo-[acyl-carrier protein] synthase
VNPFIYSGIDLVEIERFSNLNPAIRNRFFNRVFNLEEIEYIGTSLNKAAGLFAGKEAVAKALGCGIGPISWQNITISHSQSKQPHVILRENALNRANSLHIQKWSISITHTKKTAAAVAIAVGICKPE